MLYALLALFAAVLIVYIDRDGYRDIQDNQMSFLDCLYYATVSLSTTGYGDITPFTPSARLINVLVITPLRVAFLIVLIGTTVETLTAASRQALKIQRWRNSVRNHTVVIGYGTKGKTAVAAMVGDGVPPGEIVVVDTDQASLDNASSAGLVTVRGDANRSDVLRLAGAQHADTIIVATSSDPTAVMVTLSARELAPNAKIIASIRESENPHLLQQSGADSVVVSSETAGRLLGIAKKAPARGGVDGGPADPRCRARDRRTGGRAQVRSAARRGTCRSPCSAWSATVQLMQIDDPEADAMEAGDRLLYIRNAADEDD